MIKDLLKIVQVIFDVDDMKDRDQRTQDWFTMRTPYPLLLMIFTYLYFVLKSGPSFMKNREPHDLKTFIRCYNLFQVLANAAIVYYTFKFGLFTDIPITCVPLDSLPPENSLKMASVFWYLWLLKLMDFVETVIFVLRKKNKQISYLHLYHHVSTMLFSWALLKVHPGGVMTVHAATNSCIHVIMYSYYFASACGPSIQRMIIPLKKYITIAQMVQFVFLILHASQGYFQSCRVPRDGINIVIANLTLNFILFFNFYRNAYWKPKCKAT